MDKVAMVMLALSQHETDTDQFNMILQEAGGGRRLPIRIGRFEAQAIAMGLEQYPVKRPMPHDLMLQLLEREGHLLKEVIISNYEDDLFHAELVIKQPGAEERVPCRSSDAIALAVRKGCSIFAYSHILDQASYAPKAIEQAWKDGDDLSGYALNELKALLPKVLEKEAYELAKEIQKWIEEKEAS